GYKSEVLKQICVLEESTLEKAEKLEQLRWLENDFNIKVVQTNIDSIGVDTPEDLENVKRIINKIR
ncbi:MAG: 3-deoxy-manno-octulosonate cytidylyltransferase, partial [Bacteroidota bacterium]|nr:3-deoxy-manno-octulosonate cytidylyltransferase [Bacteroidota bacterium]